MNHMMIDLETLGTSPRAVVMQVGAIVFDPSEEGHSGDAVNMNVDVDSCLRLGGEVSGETIRWWLDQSDEARRSVSRRGVPIESALSAISYLWEASDCQMVWCHGATFDVPILDGYFNRLRWDRKATPWWDFSAVRDTRTLFWLAATVAGWRRPDMGETAHIAIDDAVVQARQVQSAVRALKMANLPITGGVPPILSQPFRAPSEATPPDRPCDTEPSTGDRS